MSEINRLLAQKGSQRGETGKHYKSHCGDLCLATHLGRDGWKNINWAELRSELPRLKPIEGLAFQELPDEDD